MRIRTTRRGFLSGAALAVASGLGVLLVKETRTASPIRKPTVAPPTVTPQRQAVVATPVVATPTTALAASSSATSTARPLATPLSNARATTINVQDYGAQGDGQADDFAPIKLAVDAVNLAGGGILLFPPGTYWIGRYKIGGPLGNGVTDFIFKDCDGLTVSGYGATLDVRGNFRRTFDRTLGENLRASYRDSVSLVFLRCRNFVVEGLTLDGNVERMTRDANVIEQGEHGAIRTAGCADYTLRDLACHHWQTDGIILGTTDDLGKVGESGAAVIADRRAHLENVRCANNARNGLSVIQLVDGTFANSRFEDNGRTGGAYGYHEPASGMDVEPIYAPEAAAIDARTDQLSFRSCTFRNNLHSQLMVYGGKTHVGTVLMHSCVVDRETNAYSPAIWVYGEQVTFDSCQLRVTQIRTASEKAAQTRTTVTNCDIRSDGTVIRDVGQGDTEIVGCRLTGSHTKPATVPFIALVKPTTVLRSNTITLPAAAAAPGRRTEVVNLANIALARGNRYSTDLPAGTKTQFLLNYQQTPAAEESFASPFATVAPLNIIAVEPTGQ